MASGSTAFRPIDAPELLMARLTTIMQTPGTLLELAERAALQGPIGDFEPQRGAPAAPRGGFAASVPWEWLSTRALTVGTAGAGGNTAASSTPIVDIATSLRGFSVVLDAGATVVDAGAGVSQIAVVATAPSASWVAENAADTASEPVFSAPVALTPCSLRVTAVASRALLRQSPVAEHGLRTELLQAVGRAIDAAVLGAGGVGAEPVGLAGTTGRIQQSGTSLTFATVADVERQVLATGARVERLRYITDPATRELLMTRERAAGSLHVIEGDKIGAIPVGYSNDGPSAAMFLGDWSGIVVAFYGGRPTVVVNPYRYATSGFIEFTVHCELGVGIPRPGTFAHFASVT
jgi:HK97 family phage major capsid protein